jgi:hypothetical protein
MDVHSQGERVGCAGEVLCFKMGGGDSHKAPPWLALSGENGVSRSSEMAFSGSSLPPSLNPFKFCHNIMICKLSVSQDG